MNILEHLKSKYINCANIPYLRCSNCNFCNAFGCIFIQTNKKNLARYNKFKKK